jgi:aryl-alcohol dehydrogenase-like predicted oxidoreductase
MSDLFGSVPPPKTELSRYRLLSPSAGIRVSPICLGAMSLGDQWTGYMGGKGLNQAKSEEFLDAFVEAGGNFIDTANNYQGMRHQVFPWRQLKGRR